MKQPVIDDFSELVGREHKLLKLMLWMCAILTVFLWMGAFIPSTYTMIGEAKFVYRGVFLLILSILTGYYFTKYSVRLKPEIRRGELLLKLSIVWLISELVYHGIDKLIIYDTPILEFAEILLFATVIMIVYSGVVAMIVFSRVKRIQNAQLKK